MDRRSRLGDLQEAYTVVKARLSQVEACMLFQTTISECRGCRITLGKYLGAVRKVPDVGRWTLDVLAGSSPLGGRIVECRLWVFSHDGSCGWLSLAVIACNLVSGACHTAKAGFMCESQLRLWCSTSPQLPTTLWAKQLEHALPVFRSAT